MDKSREAAARLISGGSASVEFHLERVAHYATLARTDSANAKGHHIPQMLLHARVVEIRMERD